VAKGLSTTARPRPTRSQVFLGDALGLSAFKHTDFRECFSAVHKTLAMDFPKAEDATGRSNRAAKAELGRQICPNFVPTIGSQ
jgi:hypothetical protein